MEDSRRRRGRRVLLLLAAMFLLPVVVAFAMVRAHWVDVGGLSTGFGAGNRAYDPWSEGLQFNQLKIYEAGVVDTPRPVCWRHDCAL